MEVCPLTPSILKPELCSSFIPLFICSALFTFRGWTLRVGPGPEEGVGAEPVVREPLDQQEALVYGVDGAADVVLVVGELPYEEALVRSTCETQSTSLIELPTFGCEE